ncbi:hypothetical protein [Actinoallomurus liliacearum]
MHVPAASGEVEAVPARLRLLASGAPGVPADADLTPALPSAGVGPGR